MLEVFNHNLFGVLVHVSNFDGRDAVHMMRTCKHMHELVAANAQLSQYMAQHYICVETSEEFVAVLPHITTRDTLVSAKHKVKKLLWETHKFQYKYQQNELLPVFWTRDAVQP